MSGNEGGFWICEKNCVWSAFYHKYHLDKKHNVRAGCLYYKGKCIWGNDEDFDLYEKIKTRDFSYSCGHFWTETKDNYIVDWVINKMLCVPSSEKVKWSKEELSELGFEYVRYENEKGIINKSKKLFGCSCKNENTCPITWAKHTWKRYDL
jgi:hypothetical protein